MYVVPAGELFDATIVPEVQRCGRWRRRGLAELLRVHSRAIDGADCTAQAAVRSLAAQTGRTDLSRCAFLGLPDLGLVQTDGLLVTHKRWCPLCWEDDDEGRSPLYERKLWSLSVVDVCHHHSVVLLDRCRVCGRQQPAISRDVRIGICALCGNDLRSPPVPISTGPGTDAERRLWFARQAAVLVHAVDVVALYGVETAELSCARASGFARMVVSCSDVDPSPSVMRTVRGWTTHWRRPQLEGLFSVLWQARWPVARLFPPDVAKVVDPPSV